MLLRINRRSVKRLLLHVTTVTSPDPSFSFGWWHHHLSEKFKECHLPFSTELNFDTSVFPIWNVSYDFFSENRYGRRSRIYMFAVLLRSSCVHRWSEPQTAGDHGGPREGCGPHGEGEARCLYEHCQLFRRSLEHRHVERLLSLPSDEALRLLERTRRQSDLILAETHPLQGELADALARAHASMGGNNNV